MGLLCFRGKALALALLQAIKLVHGCRDYACWGITMCSDGEWAGECAAPSDCSSTVISMTESGVIEILGWRCRVTLEQIRLALPEYPNAVVKDGTEYTLNSKVWLRHGAILEIHGPSKSSSPDAAVTLLKLKVRDPNITRELVVFLPFRVCVRSVPARISVTSGLALSRAAALIVHMKVLTYCCRGMCTKLCTSLHELA